MAYDGRQSIMHEGTAGNIPKFGEWEANDGGSPYTMYFENARKRRNNSGITPPPGASPARMVSALAGHRTRPRTVDAEPVKPQGDRTNHSQNQTNARQGGSGTVPTWGQWNESNSAAGAQQYTLVFDQLREERSAPSTPSIEQLQRPAPSRATHHDLYDHAPKGFKCCGLFRI